MSNVSAGVTLVKDKSAQLAKASAKAMHTLQNTRFDNASLFTTDIARLDDLRNALEGYSERDKLDAMRRLIGMMSQGTDVSLAFPSVVKNVVSPNTELKKLVHMYLVHYADVEPDTILLSINTFQKDMRGPNQLIRASALRVMSSIRAEVIAQPVVLAIRAAVIDSSAYVRKAACAALLKVYSVDAELKDELIDILVELLKDNSTQVLGSAIQVFCEMCPERIDIVHRIFRKVCHLLADMDQWGQIAALGMLLRYARSQFVDPDPKAAAERKQRKKAARDNTPDNDDTTDKADGEAEVVDDVDDDDDDDLLLLGDAGELDPDHRLLLSSTLPLLQSRATGVVFGVAALHVQLAPPTELAPVGKALCRVLRSSREARWLALSNCATIAATRPELLRPHLQEFFVAHDAAAAAAIKLEILTYLVDEGNISKLLREFQSYVKSEDKRFVRATIQAIGRCATQIPAVMDSCIASLMRLLSNRSEAVVAEAVIVLKRLLQTPTAAENDGVIRQLARLLDSIAVPTARAAITWLCGEYNERIAAYAPDVLRKLAKSFALEDAAVKLQIINLGAKLFVARGDDVRTLFEYVLTLAKYDLSYDVRDRSRLLRLLLLSDTAPSLNAQQKRLLCASKPVPVTRSAYADRARWPLGSLSHALNQEVDGYEPLPPFPDEQPDKSVRDNELEMSSIGQSLSSDTNATAASYTPGAAASQLASAALLSGTGEDDYENFYDDDDAEGFYDDEEEGEYSEGGTFYYYEEAEGEEGEYYDENGEYYDEDGEWAEEGADDDYYYDDNIAESDAAYLEASGDLPDLSSFIPATDDSAETFFNS